MVIKWSPRQTLNRSKWLPAALIGWAGLAHAQFVPPSEPPLDQTASPGFGPMVPGLPGAYPSFTPTIGTAARPLAPTGNVQRAPLSIDKSISVSEEYSDNINLAGRGSEQSGFLTIVQPSIRATETSARLNGYVNYSPEFLMYTGGGQNSYIRNYFDGAGTATIVENFLYFQAAGEVAQQYISPLGAQSPDTSSYNSNLAETRTLTVGPFIRSQLGRDGTYQLGYRYTDSTTSSVVLSRAHIDEVYGNAEGVFFARDLHWGLNADDQQIRYPGLTSAKLEHAEATMSYLVSPLFTPRVGIGEDHDTYPTEPGVKLGGLTYFVGASWNPSPRTYADGQIGHRDFGPTASLKLGHRTVWTDFQLNYTRDRYTSLQVLGNGQLTNNYNYQLFNDFLSSRFPDPISRSLAAQAYLAAGLPSQFFQPSNYLVNELYLLRRLDASAAFIGGYNTVTFNVSHSQQQPLSQLQSTNTNLFNILQNFKQTGASVYWEHRLAANTSVNTSLQRTHTTALSAPMGTTDLTVLALTGVRRLSRNTMATVTVRHSNETSSGFGSSYRENALIGTLRYQF